MASRSGPSSSFSSAGSYSSGSVFTSPGSYYYDVMAAQQMQQAYLRQQYAIAYAKAQRDAERREKIRQTIIAQREKELADRQARYSPGNRLANQ